MNETSSKAKTRALMPKITKTLKPSLLDVQRELEKVRSVLGPSWDGIYQSVLRKIMKPHFSKEEITLSPFLWTDEQLAVVVRGIPEFFANNSELEPDMKLWLPDVAAELQIRGDALYFQKEHVSVPLAFISQSKESGRTRWFHQLTDEAIAVLKIKERVGHASFLMLKQFEDKAAALAEMHRVSQVIKSASCFCHETLK